MHFLKAISAISAIVACASATAAENIYIGGDRFFTLINTTEDYGIMPVTGTQATYYTKNGAIPTLNTINIVGATVNATDSGVTYSLIRVGGGQCTEFVKAAIPVAGQASTWIRGAQVSPNDSDTSNSQYGRVIATFDTLGRYDNGHAAIIRGYGVLNGQKYIDVIDQNWGKGTAFAGTVAKHRLFFSGNGVANASNYYYVQK